MEIVSDENEIESLKRKFEKKLKKYSTAAKKYMPKKINILFVAESPPSCGKYVYFGDETPGALLTTIMKSLNINGPYTKERKIKLLEELKEKGAFIMDAVEYPIDNYDEKKRESIIERESENFLNRLNELFKKGIVTKETKIVLIKHSVYNVLYQKLKDCGYNVVNKGKIKFPWIYNDPQTVKDIKNVLGIVF